MLLDHGSAGYGVGEPFDRTTTSTREEVMDGQRLGTNKRIMYNGEWERRKGHGEMLQGARSGAAKKVIFFYKAGRSAVDYERS